MQTPIKFLLMLVYVNISSDKGEHLLIGIKFMLPDRPVYQVCTVLVEKLCGMRYLEHSNL